MLITGRSFGWSSNNTAIQNDEYSRRGAVLSLQAISGQECSAYRPVHPFNKQYKLCSTTQNWIGLNQGCSFIIPFTAWRVLSVACLSAGYFWWCLEGHSHPHRIIITISERLGRSQFSPVDDYSQFPWWFMILFYWTIIIRWQIINLQSLPRRVAIILILEVKMGQYKRHKDVLKAFR